MKTEVLNHNQILRICNRFAFQIIENSNDNEILIIGIKSKGYEIAKIVKKQIETLVNTKVTLKHIKIDKNNPKDSVKSDLSINDEKNTVFLIDDVLNTGKTLAYSISYLLDYILNCRLLCDSVGKCVVASQETLLRRCLLG